MEINNRKLQRTQININKHYLGLDQIFSKSSTPYNGVYSSVLSSLHLMWVLAHAHKTHSQFGPI
jgi:hypothetical protein